jgi:subtilisin family serine protease
LHLALGALSLLWPARVLYSQEAGPELREALDAGQSARVVVVLREPALAAAGLPARMAVVAAAQERVLRPLRPDQFVLERRFAAVAGFAGRVTRNGLDALLANPEVLRVDLDVAGGGNLAQSVPLVRADVVQGMGYTGKGVTVAVLDSGIDAHHPDLAGDLVAERCFCTNEDGSGCCPGGKTSRSGPGSAPDGFGHGTNVAGIITSTGHIAPRGVAPDAKIVAVRVLDDDNRFAATAQIVSGLDWIISSRHDVRVVNMSLGTDQLFGGDCDNARAYTIALARAIDTLRDRGVVVFASSGNAGSTTGMSAPACVRASVSVGAVYDSNVGSVTALGCTDAVTAADSVTCFTNSDAALNLLAPGAPITSTGLGSRTSTFYGTSQASAHAAAAAAILLQVKKTLTPRQIEAALEASGLPVTDPRNGRTFPALDVLQAVDRVR